MYSHGFGDSASLSKIRLPNSNVSVLTGDVNGAWY